MRRTIEDYKRFVWRTKQVPNAVRVFLLYLADNASTAPNLRVSIPRPKMASDLAVSERAIKLHTRTAIDTGFLSRVAGGYRGVTAEYQLTFPDLKRGTPQVTPNIKGVQKPRPHSMTVAVTPFDTSVTLSDGERGTPQVTPIYSGTTVEPTLGDDGSDGERRACPYCEFAGCGTCDGWSVG